MIQVSDYTISRCSYFLIPEAAHHFQDNLRRMPALVQLSILMVVACAIILNLPWRGSSWLFGMICLIIQTTVLQATELVNALVDSHLGKHSFLRGIQSLPYFQTILSDFPRDIQAATAQFNLEGKRTIYATCLKCHEIYAPTIIKDIPVYPEVCSHMANGQPICQGILVRWKNVNGQTIFTPIKAYVSYDFKDWLAGLLSRSGIEDAMDSAWDRMNTSSPEEPLNDIFQGSVIRDFKGPDGSTHFGMAGETDAGRYLFAFSVDFFNSLGNKAAGKKVSIGAVTISCLNLPIEMRNLPENMFLAGIISGEPSKSQINPYLHPIVNAFLEL